MALDNQDEPIGSMETLVSEPNLPIVDSSLSRHSVNVLLPDAPPTSATSATSPPTNPTKSAIKKKFGSFLTTLQSIFTSKSLAEEILRTLVAVVVFIAVTALMTQAQMESDRWFDQYNRKLNVKNVVNKENIRVMSNENITMLEGVDISHPFAVDPLHDRLFDILPNWSDKRGWLSDLCLSIFIATSIFFNILLPTLERIPYQRFVVLRRVLWIISVLYVFRMITFLVTTVPSPMHNCVPKYVAEDDLNEYLSLMGKMVSGKVTACTDNIYSGHTTLVVVMIFTFFTYSGRWWLKIYSILHGLAVVSLILLTRLHYTVDVLIAGFMASFVFITYHFMLTFFIDNIFIQKLSTNQVASDEALLKERRITNRLLNNRVCKIIWWIDGLDLRVKSATEPPVTIVPMDQTEIITNLDQANLTTTIHPPPNIHHLHNHHHPSLA